MSCSIGMVFNVASIMVYDNTYSLKRDLKYRFWNKIYFLICMCAHEVKMKTNCTHGSKYMGHLPIRTCVNFEEKIIYYEN
jgi:hypothetical protein